ncbi:MAG: hypothetical protein AB1486_03620 [Planctomycetota bacterium]
MANPPNAYCEQLGIVPPKVEEVLQSKGAKLFDALCAALLERGRPMLLEEIVERLERAGAVARTGDLAFSLQKAWHGREPVYRDSAGRFGINLSAPDLKWRVAEWQRARAPRVSTEPPPLPVRGDDEPLSAEEVDAALRDRAPGTVSAQRLAAAILDSHGTMLGLDEINDALKGLSRSHRRIEAETLRRGKEPLVDCDSSGLWKLASNESGLRAMRRSLRQLGAPTLCRMQRDKQLEATRESWEAREAEREDREMRAAAALRRAVMRAVPAPARPRAIALLDIGAHSIQTFVGDELLALPGALEEFDLVAGLSVRETLEALHLSGDRWHLIDLKPPQKQRRLNRAGRMLKITPELLIAGTVHISRPFGDATKVAQYMNQYMKTGDDGKLRRRITSDVKALAAIYSYGILHGCVCLRWGFLDEMLPVHWDLPGDPLLLYRTLERAMRAGAPVEVVAGTAPGWRDPWARGQKGMIVKCEMEGFWLRGAEGDSYFDRYEIQAIRMLEPPAELTSEK